MAKIELNRAEGPKAECGRIMYEARDSAACFACAESRVRTWALSAPADGGYDKVDVRVKLDDEHAFEFRFDMTRDHATAPRPVHKEALAHCRFFGRLWVPPHMNEETRDRALDDTYGLSADDMRFYRECAEILEREDVR